ncbi:MAG: glycosyltransferase family 4 protein [Halobaculum sp.]
MSVLYGPVDVLTRSVAGSHLSRLESLDALAGVLTMETTGYDPAPAVPVHSMPWKTGKLRFLNYRLGNNVGDLYLRRAVTGTDADALVGWSGMSSATIERANDHGLETFVVRASPHIVESHRTLADEYRRFGMRVGNSTLDAWKECYEYQAADWIITVSDYAAETFERRGIDREKVLTCPYPVFDVDRYFDTPDRSDPDTFTVCTATTVDLLRGVPYLLEAWATFADGRDDVELRVAGNVAEDFPDALYERFSARSDVTFHGFVDDVPGLYAESDAFVLPSLGDGGPTGPFEAMAAGLPVIVSDSMGARDDVRDGENGFVVPARDADAIHDRLVELYESPDLRERLGTAAAETISGTQGRHADAFERIYREYVLE